MNEGKARERQDRAAKAEALLRNELFVEAFEYLDEQFIDAWKTSAINDAGPARSYSTSCRHLALSRGTSLAWSRMVS